MRDFPAWVICTVDDILILNVCNVLSLSNSKKINMRREWWRLFHSRNGRMFLNGVTGTIVKYKIQKGHVIRFAWRVDPNATSQEIKKRKVKCTG